MPVPGIRPFTIVTGHYGTGKTNLAINLALDLAESYDQVTVVDLDIVNPYFRSSEYAGLLDGKGVRLIAPTFAGTTLDTPSLPATIGSVFDVPGAVIFDVGGDDVGATALGRFQHDIERLEYDMLYVVNRYRDLTTTPEEAAALLGEIEAASKLIATGVVNNSHLKSETTLDVVLDSVEFGRETARKLDLPLVCTTVPQALACELVPEGGEAGPVENAYPVGTYVRTPWESEPETGEKDGERCPGS